MGAVSHRPVAGLSPASGVPGRLLPPGAADVWTGGGLDGGFPPPGGVGRAGGQVWGGQRTPEEGRPDSRLCKFSIAPSTRGI